MASDGRPATSLVSSRPSAAAAFLAGAFFITVFLAGAAFFAAAFFVACAFLAAGPPFR